jgi:hypothetical protein
MSTISGLPRGNPLGNPEPLSMSSLDNERQPDH